MPSSTYRISACGTVNLLPPRGPTPLGVLDLLVEEDAKLLAPGAFGFGLLNRLLSVVFSLSLLNDSGEKIGAIARLASSFTNLTKSWNDTSFSPLLWKTHVWRHHLVPVYGGNLVPTSCKILVEFSSSMYSMDFMAPSQRMRRSQNSCRLWLSPSVIWGQLRSLKKLVSFGDPKWIPEPVS